MTNTSPNANPSAAANTLMLSVSGCRGIVGQSLTPEVVSRFAGAFAGWCTERAAGKRVIVVLGRDGRKGNAMVHHGALAGLVGAGADVVDVGVAMTPTVGVITDQVARDYNDATVAGMVLTASHNPQIWNGLKALWTGPADAYGSAASAPGAADAAQIVARHKEGRVGLVGWDGVGHIAHASDAAANHVHRVLAALEDAGVCDDAEALAEGFQICVDSVNASGVAGARFLLESMGCDEILHLGGEDTGIFPHPPEPLAENLVSVCEAVRQSGCAAGFVQDPDADRLALIDEKGRFVGEEYTLVLGVLALLTAAKRRGEDTSRMTLAANLSTSRMIDDVAARFGATVLRTAVGEANVVSAMKGHDSIAGGEGNGGVIWPRITYVRDSLSAMALTLSLMKSGTPLSKIVDDMPSYAIRKRKVELHDREQAIRAAKKIQSAFANERLDTQDGVRVDIESKRAWLHVRGSNTEPIMRLIAEAPTTADADALLDHAERVING
jgi:phosphomannomutase